MPIEGVVANRTRAIIPITWDALSRDSRFGDNLLQSSIDTAVEAVFGEFVEEPFLENFSRVVIDYVAKVAAISIIPAGVDFWMSEPLSESATGTSENHSFDVRAERLQELRRILLEETRARQDEIVFLIGYRRPTGKSVPRSSTMNDEFLTPSPQEFPRPYTRTGLS